MKKSNAIREILINLLTSEKSAKFYPQITGNANILNKIIQNWFQNLDGFIKIFEDFLKYRAVQRRAYPLNLEEC